MMKTLNLIFFILASCDVYAQLQFEPFKPSTYTPQTPDYSILQRSLENNERRRNDAYKLYLDLVELCNETAKDIPPTETDWFKSYCDHICGDVNSQIELGNSQSAIRLSYEYMSQLRNDNNIRYRIDSYKQYCDDMDNHGIYHYRNGRVSQEAYNWFCYRNQYEFSPKYDSLGSLTGYTPVHVSYLYPSINWNEAFQFITSRGRTQIDIDNGWALYFDYDPDKLFSLRQEYEVVKFYYEYYLSICDNPELNAVEKEQLLNAIKNYKAILFDSDNQSSYEAYVANMKMQLVVQPSKSLAKKKRSTNNGSRKKHTK